MTLVIPAEVGRGREPKPLALTEDQSKDPSSLTAMLLQEILANAFFRRIVRGQSSAVSGNEFWGETLG